MVPMKELSTLKLQTMGAINFDSALSAQATRIGKSPLFPETDVSIEAATVLHNHFSFKGFW